MHPHLLQGSDAAEGQGRREDSAGARSETFPAGQREQDLDRPSDLAPPAAPEPDATAASAGELLGQQRQARIPTRLPAGILKDRGQHGGALVSATQRPGPSFVARLLLGQRSALLAQPSWSSRGCATAAISSAGSAAPDQPSPAAVRAVGSSPSQGGGEDEARICHRGSLDSWLLSFFIPFRFVCRSLTKRAMLELRASQVRAAEGHHSCTALLWPLHVTGRCFTVA